MVTVLDDFEDGDIAEYAGDTSEYSVSSSDPVYEGTYSLQTTADVIEAITRTDKTIPPSGTPFGAWHYGDIYSTFGIDVSNSSGFLWAVQSETDGDALECYSIITESASGSELSYAIVRFDGGGSSDNVTLAETDTSVPKNTWHKLRIAQWTDGGDITVEVVDKSGTVVTSASTTDDTYGEGGFGFYNGGGDGGTVAYDYAFKPSTLSPPDPPSNLSAEVQ